MSTKRKMSSDRKIELVLTIIAGFLMIASAMLCGVCILGQCLDPVILPIWIGLIGISLFFTAVGMHFFVVHFRMFIEEE